MTGKIHEHKNKVHIVYAIKSYFRRNLTTCVIFKRITFHNKLVNHYLRVNNILQIKSDKKKK